MKEKERASPGRIGVPSIAAILAVVVVSTTVAAAAASVPLTLTLRPAAADSAGRVPYVDVTLAYTPSAITSGQPILKMPLLTSNVVTVAKTIEDLSVKDASGLVPVMFKDDAENSEVAYRHWMASRPTNGPLTVQYRAPISNLAAPRGAAPPLELRSDSGAFSGAGETFLILPEPDSSQAMFEPIKVRWNLDDMAAGAVGVSSLGVGDVIVPASKDLQSLRSCFFMGGRVELHPQTPPTSGFFSAWHGNAPFNLRDLMKTEEKLYAFYDKFFKQEATTPYGVFLRENPVNAGGGMELSGSFVATFGPKTRLDDLKITLAHEMLHTFVGSLDKPAGLLSSWYSEGMAVYYARLLALRAGQITADQFLHDLNTTAGRYYSDALISTPNDEIPSRFWADTRIRVLPYDRGSMYLAVVDGEVRAASGGKRTLDDLLLAMVERRKHNLPLDQNAWVEQVAKRVGRKRKNGF